MIRVASSRLAEMIRSSTWSGSSYRVWIPSRFRTARPPSRPISAASRGPTTPSMAAAMMGMSKRRPQSSHAMSTSLEFTVTAPGTRAMSSKPYAILALRPRPIHMPMCPCPPLLLHFGVVYRSRPPLSRTLGVGLLPDQPETLQPEVGVHVLDGAGHPLDQGGQAPGGDDLGLPVHLGPDALDETVHEAGVAVDQPRLDIGHGVAPDGLFRLHELDAVETCGPREERLRRQGEPGGDGPPDELAAGVDAVEVRGRPEIHHDEGWAVERHRGDGVAEAIGADLGRVVHAHGQFHVDPRLDAEGPDPEVLLAHPLERLLDRRDDVGDGDRLDPPAVDPLARPEGLDEDAVLVGGLLAAARQAPRDQEALAVEDAEARVRIPHFNHQQHRPLQGVRHALLRYGADPVATRRTRAPASVLTRRAPSSARSSAIPAAPPSVVTRRPRVTEPRRQASRTGPKPPPPTDGTRLPGTRARPPTVAPGRRDAPPGARARSPGPGGPRRTASG